MSDQFDAAAEFEVAPRAASYRVQRPLLDPGTRRLAIIAGGLGTALCAIVGVWSFSKHHGGHIPVVEADSRPLRVKPDNPGGMQLAGANDEIMSGDVGPQNGKLAAAPEAPDPAALRAQQQAPAPKPAPMAAIAPASSPPSTIVAPAAKSATSAAPPSAPPASASANPTAVPKTTGAQEAASSAAPKTHAEVQLAALESEGGAKAEWDRLNRKMPDVLKGHHPAVLKAERDGKVFWRLRTGGFDDVAQATAFCERVRSKGAGCSITSF